HGLFRASIVIAARRFWAPVQGSDGAQTVEGDAVEPAISDGLRVLAPVLGVNRDTPRARRCRVMREFVLLGVCAAALCSVESRAADWFRARRVRAASGALAASPSRATAT